MTTNITYQALRDLLDEVKTCMGGDACDYQLFVSLGMPPAECNSIAAWYRSNTRARSDNSDCSSTNFDTDFSVTITRCCARSDAGLNFDHIAEQNDAKCFLDDLDLLRNCIICNASQVLSDYTLGCGAIVTSTVGDIEKRGGCYSATINLEFLESVCCD